MNENPDHILDAATGNRLMNIAPRQYRPYLQLARFDRPIGFWLLLLPCWAAMALARLDQAWVWHDAILAGLFAIGAVVMRGAGCTYNDILDRDLDAKVIRTKARPLANNTLNVRQAIGFLLFQLFVGLLVWLCLPGPAKMVSLAALPLVALYPLMKRFTWWPQAWLGLTFNWGALVGFVAIRGEITSVAILFYLGLAFWTLGYDTIYAHQDREDDALIGIKSTARLFGKHSKGAIGAIYFICIALLLLASLQHVSALPLALQRQGQYAVLLATGLFAMNLSNQAFATDFNNPDQCLAVFKKNKRFGLEYTALLALAPLLMSALLSWQAGNS